MADIIMCKGDGGSDCANCYRRMAIPSPYYQAVIEVPRKEGEECNFYWPMTDRERAMSTSVG